MDDDFNITLQKICALGVLLGILFLVILLVVTAGCVSATKRAVSNAWAEETPIPIVTVEDTPQPEPTTIEATPEPTKSKEDIIKEIHFSRGLLTGEWYQWYREDVSGKQDMIIRATVYDYYTMTRYHWRDFSWGSRAKRVETAYPGYMFLFVLIHVESIGTSDKTYGFGPDHFMVQVNNTLISPVDEYSPEWIIVETENWWDRYHIEAPGPYGYKRVQEAGTGIISAEELEWLQNGWDWDGYLIYEIPADTRMEDIKILGRFDNVGGNTYWQLGYI